LIKQKVEKLKQFDQSIGFDKSQIALKINNWPCFAGVYRGVQMCKIYIKP
jgi:hypothetical protein